MFRLSRGVTFLGDNNSNKLCARWEKPRLAQLDDGDAMALKNLNHVDEAMQQCCRRACNKNDVICDHCQSWQQFVFAWFLPC